MTTTIDQLSILANAADFGDTKTEYFAQTFRAAGSAAETRSESGNRRRDRARRDGIPLARHDTCLDEVGFHPGTVLFESPLLVEPFNSDHTVHPVVVNTSHLALVPGILEPRSRRIYCCLRRRCVERRHWREP